MRAYQDADLLLVQEMRAPPPLEDARSSLAYWERRRKALPLRRRAARREAREMAMRWQARVLAAEQARFEASLAGRLLAVVGLSNAWQYWVRLKSLGLLRFAWILIPPKLKLVAGAVAATWLVMVFAVVATAVAVFVQLLG